MLRRQEGNDERPGHPPVFKIKIKNKANVSPEDLKAALDQLNKILGANNSELSAQFVPKGEADFTVKLVNAKTGPFGLFNAAPKDRYGENDAIFGGLFGLADSAHIYANNISDAVGPQAKVSESGKSSRMNLGTGRCKLQTINSPE